MEGLRFGTFAPFGHKANQVIAKNELFFVSAFNALFVALKINYTHNIETDLWMTAVNIVVYQAIRKTT